MIVGFRTYPIARAAPEARTPPVEPAVGRDVTTWQEMAGGLASLLSPAAALCFALAVWRMGQDLGYARSFFITEGTLSHWQVWLAAAGVVRAAGQWLNRRARGDPDEQLNKERHGCTTIKW